jgi:hypothetical protein
MIKTFQDSTKVIRVENLSKSRKDLIPVDDNDFFQEK